MDEADATERSTKGKFWQAHIAAWKTSGLSQQVYCRNNHLAVATFGYWRRKLNLLVEKQNNKPRFYPLAIAAPKQAASTPKFENTIRLSLDDKRFVIEIDDEFSPATLQRLILALEQL